MTRTCRLSSAEIAAYREHGYIGPFDLIERDEALALGRLVSSRRRSLIERIRRRVPSASSLPDLLALCTRKDLLDRVEDLLGPNLVVWRTGIFVKRPGERRYAFHQDDAFWHLRNVATSPPNDAWHLGLSAWIALNDTDPENGCVEVVPGSHQRLLPHVPYPWDYGKGVSAEMLAGQKIEPMIMKAGQCFLFHVLTVHGSGANESKRVRSGFSARFTVPGVVSPGARFEFGDRPLLVRGEEVHARKEQGFS